MRVRTILKQFEKLVVDNSPSILTGIGVVGTVSTAVLTGKASFKAYEIIQTEAESGCWFVQPDDTFTTKDKVKLVWKLYIPAVGTAVLTITAIIAANRVSTRRAAALAAAYSLSEKAFHEYKEAVVERIGASKETHIRDELAQDRINKKPVDSSEVIVTGGGRVLCFETMSGRYFESDMETLRKAQNDLNYVIIQQSYGTLHEFYEMIGLPPTPYSSEVGWTNLHPFELAFSAVLATDGRPCIAIDYTVYPIRDYY